MQATPSVSTPVTPRSMQLRRQSEKAFIHGFHQHGRTPPTSDSHCGYQRAPHPAINTDGGFTFTDSGAGSKNLWAARGGGGPTWQWQGPGTQRIKLPPQRSRPAGPAHPAAAVTLVPTAQRETRYPRSVGASGGPLPDCNVHLSSDV